MKSELLVIRCALASLALLSGLLCAQESQTTETPPASDSRAKPIRLKNYEPTFLGYTKDSDDEAFMDFTISLQYPIFADWLEEGNRFHVLPYFAVTARLGQYIGTRDSSPVISKRFNPKIFFRYARGGFPEQGESPDNYVDFEYAHESNGQSVDSASSFQTVAEAVGGTEHAKDYISRGWDYLGLTAKGRLSTQFYLYVSRRWYCGCLLQKNIEERFDFEDAREVQSIRQVSGWRALLKFASSSESALIDRAALTFDTGTRDTFKYDTVRLEAGIQPLGRFFGVPVVFWGQTGYLSDLAQYYKKVHSYGVAFVFETFAR